jgi:hypothetical protein
MAKLADYIVPRVLYRFRAGADLMRELESLIESYLWFSDIFSLNDPMEGYFRYLGTEQDDELYRGVSEVIKENKFNLGVCCLTDSPTSGPFWGQYAREAAGFCIEYNVKELLQNLPDTVDLTRIYYSNDLPEVDPSTVYADATQAKKILSYKSKGWQHESEWRLISGSKGKVEYKKHSCISRIFIGKYASPELSEELTDFSRKNSIELLRMNVKGFSIYFDKMERIS